MTMKKCDGTALLTDQTMNCSTVDYFCVDGYVDGDDVFVDVTNGTYPSEVSWEFYKSNGTAVTFYNENGAETDGTACQYVKSTTAACAQYDNGSGSCTSNSYSSSPMPTPEPTPMPTPQPTFEPSNYTYYYYDDNYGYKCSSATNGCSGAYVKAMDSCKCISLEEFTIIVFFFFFLRLFDGLMLLLLMFTWILC